MTVIEILQKIKADTEQLLVRLNTSGSRLYEISTTGTIVECTAQMREQYEGVCQRLQRVIEMLRK